jgi:hypothetical protein
MTPCCTFGDFRMNKTLPALLIAILLITHIAVAGDYLTHMDILVEAMPSDERMIISVQMHFSQSAGGKRLYFLMAVPAKTGECANAETGDAISFKIHPPPEAYKQYGYTTLQINLPDMSDGIVVEFSYEYDRESYTGYALNPGTWDNLYYGQITKESIFSSHLFYYPFPIEGEVLESADLTISVPSGWVAVSSGELISELSDSDTTIYTYQCDFESGILPYPLAISPYESVGYSYQDRFPVTIYFTPEDRQFAEEKMMLLRDKILPFLEDLMGPYPFPELRVVEVFPHSGNTGLATRALVMLSQKVWFAEAVGQDDWKSGVIALVDETAHQWNFWKVGFPYILAEAVSQYTDLLYVERFNGRQTTEDSIASFCQSYTRIAGTLQEIFDLRQSGLSKVEISKQLNESDENMTAYWPFTEHAEVPITDPGIFYTLYFFKGAVALHALRNLLGDEVFFRGFKNLFMHNETGVEISLDGFRESFETESGKNLEDFFQLWYFDIGMPEY